MAKLYVYYGAMNSGKSLNLLANVHTYEEQGKNVLLMKPSFDSRSGLGIIDSRVGISHNCFSFDDKEKVNRKSVNTVSNSLEFIIAKTLSYVFVHGIPPVINKNSLNHE